MTAFMSTANRYSHASPDMTGERVSRNILRFRTAETGLESRTDGSEYCGQHDTRDVVKSAAMTNVRENRLYYRNPFYWWWGRTQRYQLSHALEGR